jgi:predicted AAA+ superfamily ATPase
VKEVYNKVSGGSYFLIGTYPLKIDYATLKEYLYYSEQAKILFESQYFSYSVKTQSRNNKKICCIDNGLRNAISFRFSRDEGRLAENLVFVELM